MRIVPPVRRTNVWVKLTGIGVGGALGALARYGLGGWVQRSCGTGFPWGTLAVNLLGCFVFGLVWSLAELHLRITSEMRAMFFVGFMGAFTTFSTFAYESANLMRDAQFMPAAANMLIQNVVGVAFILLGLALGRAV